MTLDVGAMYLAWTEGFEAVRAARAAGLDGDDIEAVFASVLHESAERGVA